MQSMKKVETKKNAERRREEELLQKMKIERATEAERVRKEDMKKKEEDKKKIGLGRGRNARKRKKEEERRSKEQEEGLEKHAEVLEDDKEQLKAHIKGFEVQENSWKCVEEQGLKQVDSGDNTMRSCIQEPKNRSLVEFMERQILELEEELECPVCLEVATAAPIYKCPDDHLICRCTKTFI